MRITDIECPGCGCQIYAIRRRSGIATVCGDKLGKPCRHASEEHHTTARLIGALQFLQHDRDREALSDCCPRCLPKFDSLHDYLHWQDVTVLDNGSRYCMTCDNEWRAA